MSGTGQGNKSRKRDLIDAPKITSAPAKISNKGNFPKKLKGDAKKAFRSTPTPPPVVFVHDQFNSSDESEAEEQQNRAVESSFDDSGMSPAEEIPVPKGLGEDGDEGGDEEEEDFSWKCHLLEFIQQSARFLIKQVRDTKRKI